MAGYYSVVLLSRDFGKLTLITFLIAAPISWYGVQWWLGRYAYNGDRAMGPHIFAGLAFCRCGLDRHELSIDQSSTHQPGKIAEKRIAPHTRLAKASANEAVHNPAWMSPCTLMP